MKIAIVGKGTSSILTAMRCILDGHSVDIFYDPDKPHLKVGESATPNIASIIKHVFDIGVTDLINEGIVSLKAGVKFINWGIGNSFIHGFNQTIAFQFDTLKFNEFFHKKLKEEKSVNYFAEKVNNYSINLNSVTVNNKNYDFLVFCSGWDETDEYENPIFETVNSAITYSKNTVVDPICTLHEATEDGWQFGLPFPDENITRHGYLFNKNFISSADAHKKIHSNNSNVIEWTPKFSKKLLQNKFVAYNGNRLFFSEPLQALSLGYYLDFATHICDYLRHNKSYESFIMNNSRYRLEIFDYQISLAWHYSYGSIYNTPFWNDVTDRAKKIMEFVHWSKSESILDNFSVDHLNKNNQTFRIGSFAYDDFKTINCGMTGIPTNKLFSDHIFGDINPTLF